MLLNRGNGERDWPDCQTNSEWVRIPLTLIQMVVDSIRHLAHAGNYSYLASLYPIVGL